MSIAYTLPSGEKIMMDDGMSSIEKKDMVDGGKGGKNTPVQGLIKLFEVIHFMLAVGRESYL